MKKFKFCVLGFVFMFLMLLPIPFALAWGYKAIPLALVVYALAWKILKHLLTYQD